LPVFLLRLFLVVSPGFRRFLSSGFLASIQQFCREVFRPERFPGVPHEREGAGLESTESNSESAARFTHLLHGSRSRIFGYIYSLVRNLADAEDLFQETSAQLWRKFDEFDPEGDFGRWATRFAHYTVLNFIRVNSRRHTFFSEELLEQIAKVHEREATELYAARTEALNHCFERLPKADQQLVESCYAGDRTMKEVAHEERRTADAIYQAMSRIRRALLLCIEKAVARSAADG